jgi:hypothetical protein
VRPPETSKELIGVTNEFHQFADRTGPLALLRFGAGGWKIASAASTIELDGCEPEAKEKQ